MGNRYPHKRKSFIKNIIDETWNLFKKAPRSILNFFKKPKFIEISISILMLVVVAYVGFEQNKINKNLYDLSQQQLKTYESLAKLQISDTLQPVLQADYDETGRKIKLTNHGKLPIYIDIVGLEKQDSNNYIDLRIVKSSFFTGNQAHRIVAPGQEIDIDINDVLVANSEFFQDQIKTDGSYSFIYQIFFKVDNDESKEIYQGRIFFLAQTDNTSFLHMKISMAFPDINIVSIQGINNFKELHNHLLQTK